MNLSVFPSSGEHTRLACFGRRLADRFFPAVSAKTKPTGASFDRRDADQCTRDACAPPPPIAISRFSILNFKFLAIVAAALAFSINTQAQLPVARLNTIFPPAATIATPIDVRANGADLDDARELRFSNPGVTAALKPDGQFTVTAATNVPPGIYEARVIGRFGASNPRAFVISDRPQILEASTNNAFANAQDLALGSSVVGKVAPSAADYFRVKAAKGQRLLIECLARRIDSRLDPVLVLSDATGRELDRARTGGLLDFTAPADGDYILKLHDLQFRGGDEYWYILNVRKSPWIDFARPAAVERGAKTKITLYGRNLPNAKPSDYKLEGHPLDQLEVEIEAPKDAAPSYLTRLPAAAAIDGFEYRLPSADGASNPIYLSFTTAPVVLESVTNDKFTNAIEVVAPCEIQGQFFPRRDLDWYQFQAKKGEVYFIEVYSQRLGLNTDPFLVIARKNKNDKGEESLADTQEVYDNDANVGGRDFNTATRDPSARLEIKNDGLHCVQVRDLFGETVTDPRRLYRLSIRKETPDFSLVAYAPAAPPLINDSKEIANSGAFLRRGDTTPIRVLALRRDNFGGDIDIIAENLPAGVTAAPAKIKSGANEAFLLLASTEDAPAWTGPIRVVGKSKIAEHDITHVARPGAIAWQVPNYDIEPITSVLAQELLLNVSGAEQAPLAIAAPAKPIEVVQGAKANLPITITRRHEFNGIIKFKALLDPPKEFEAAASTTNATVELELDKAKYPPGQYHIPILATSPGRYRRVTVDEAKTIEAEIKKLKDELAAATEAPKKDSLNNQIKAQEARLAYKDLTTTIYTSATLNVAAPPPPPTAAK
jgi:hypothetical protein